MTNRLFKKLFAFIPRIGDNNALLKTLNKAIQNMKYPSQITLETLNALRKDDLDRGFKPNPKLDNPNNPQNPQNPHTPNNPDSPMPNATQNPNPSPNNPSAPQGSTQNPHVDSNENNINPHTTETRQNVGNGNNRADKHKTIKTFAIPQEEQAILQEHFKFKNKKSLVRGIRENEIEHAIKSHGDQAKEAQRGNIAITRDEIFTNYPAITKEYDERYFTDKSIIYVKQVNGHHIAIEEALLGQDKLIFKSFWKTKGKYNKEVLLKNVKATPYPHNADEAVKHNAISNPSLEQGNPPQSHLNNILPQTPQFIYKENKPLSDAALQTQIKEGKNTQVLKEYEEREIQALASHPILQNAENAHKYMQEVQHTQHYIAQNEARILQDIEAGNIVTNFEKSPELQAQLAQALKESIVDILPNEARAKLAFDNRNFIFRHDTNLQITGIHEIKPQTTQPKNYDEFMALERNQTQELESIKEQTLQLLGYEKAQELPQGKPLQKQQEEVNINENKNDNMVPLEPSKASEYFDSLEASPMPASLSVEEFKNGFEYIINKDNFITHLQNSTDKRRLEYLHLVDSTLQEPHLRLNTLNKKGKPTKEHIKKFKGLDNDLFYIVITPQEDNRLLLTGFPTSKKRDIEKRINTALHVEARDSGALSSAQSDSYNAPTPH